MQQAPGTGASGNVLGGAFEDSYILEPLDLPPLGIGDLSIEWQQRAQDDVQEKVEWRQRDIQALRDLVLAETNLCCATDDQFLLRFLRAKKFDYEKSFKMLQRYCAMRSKSPANFAKSLPSQSKEVFSHQLQTILPHRDRLARRVFLFRSGQWDVATTSPEDLFSSNYLCLEMLAREQKTQISGIVAIVDMAEFGWYHLMQLSVEYMKSMAALIQNSFPLRFREIHIVNESYLFDIIFALIKPFLTEKIRNRIRFHGADLKSLHKFISPSILPAEYGGDQPSFDNSDMVQELNKMEGYFIGLQENIYRDHQLPRDLYEKPSHPLPAYCMSGTLPD